MQHPEKPLLFMIYFKINLPGDWGVCVCVCVVVLISPLGMASYSL